MSSNLIACMGPVVAAKPKHGFFACQHLAPIFFAAATAAPGAHRPAAACVRTAMRVLACARSTRALGGNILFCALFACTHLLRGCIAWRRSHRSRMPWRARSCPHPRFCTPPPRKVDFASHHPRLREKCASPRQAARSCTASMHVLGMDTTHAFRRHRCGCARTPIRVARRRGSLAPDAFPAARGGRNVGGAAGRGDRQWSSSSSSSA